MRRRAAPQAVPEKPSQPYNDEQIRKSIDGIATELKAIREKQAEYEKTRSEREAEPIPSNWAMVLVTALAAGVVWYQSWQTKRSADAAEGLMLLSNQPKLIVRGIARTDEPGPNGLRPNARVQLQNVGNTAAHNVQTNIRWFVWKQLPRRNPVDQMVVIAVPLEKPIEPGLWHVENVPRVHIPLADGPDMDWDEGGEDYIVGHVYYTDRKGKSRPPLVFWRRFELSLWRFVHVEGEEDTEES